MPWLIVVVFISASTILTATITRINNSYHDGVNAFTIASYNEA